MSGYSFDIPILVDALTGIPAAGMELRRASSSGAGLWISRIAWMEIMAKTAPSLTRDTEQFLSGFAVDEMDADIASRAAALRRERPKLKSRDAVILASAMVRGRILVTRNTKDFPSQMPGIRVPYTI